MFIVKRHHSSLGCQCSALCTNCRPQLFSEHLILTSAVDCWTFIVDGVLRRPLSLAYPAESVHMHFQCCHQSWTWTGARLVRHRSQLCGLSWSSISIRTPHFATKHFLYTLHKVFHKCRPQAQSDDDKSESLNAGFHSCKSQVQQPLFPTLLSRLNWRNMLKSAQRWLEGQRPSTARVDKTVWPTDVLMWPERG